MLAFVIAVCGALDYALMTWANARLEVRDSRANPSPNPDDVGQRSPRGARGHPSPLLTTCYVLLTAYCLLLTSCFVLLTSYFFLLLTYEYSYFLLLTSDLLLLTYYFPRAS